MKARRPTRSARRRAWCSRPNWRLVFRRSRALGHRCRLGPSCLLADATVRAGRGLRSSSIRYEGLVFGARIGGSPTAPAAPPAPRCRSLPWSANRLDTLRAYCPPRPRSLLNRRHCCLQFVHAIGSKRRACRSTPFSANCRGNQCSAGRWRGHFAMPCSERTRRHQLARAHEVEPLTRCTHASTQTAPLRSRRANRAVNARCASLWASLPAFASSSANDEKEARTN